MFVIRSLQMTFGIAASFCLASSLAGEEDGSIHLECASLDPESLIIEPGTLVTINTGKGQVIVGESASVELLHMDDALLSAFGVAELDNDSLGTQAYYLDLRTGAFVYVIAIQRCRSQFPCERPEIEAGNDVGYCRQI